MTVNVEVIANKNGKKHIFYLTRKLHLETMDVLYRQLESSGFEVVSVRTL